MATRKQASIRMIEAGDWGTAPTAMDPGVWFINLGSERDRKVVALAAPRTNNRASSEHMGRAVIDEFTEFKWITMEPSVQQYPE